MEMLTLEAFEEASECVKKVAQETKLIYSEYFSVQTGNKVFLKAENMQVTTKSAERTIRSVRCQKRNGQRA